MDKLTLDRIKLLHPKLRDEALEIYEEICKVLEPKSGCRFTSTLRTFAEQDALYAQGRTKPGGVVTWAKGGQSYHNYGLALDIVLLGDFNNDGKKEVSWDLLKDFDGDHQADWKEIVNIFIMHGWEWGGNWNKPKTDNPHFQKTFSKSIKDLQKIAKDNQGYPIL